MKKLLSMALALMMVLTLLAVPAMAADSINITEVNDYGTVTAEVDSTTITVVADTGFYLYSATLNGADILASMTAGYDNVRDSAVCPKEQWTYTAAAPLTAADELVVAYGYYTETPYVAGGDANTALGTSGAWNTNTTGGTEIVNLDGNNVFLYHSGRLRSTGTWDWVVGDKWIVQYDAKSASGLTTEELAEEMVTVRYYGDDTSVCPNGRKYTLPAATADWVTYTTYVDIITADKDYVFFQVEKKKDSEASMDMYFDNLKVAKLTKAGIVPESYDITVTEVNDYGTVTAPASVYSNATAAIKIVPEMGYYVHAITVDGVDVTANLVETYTVNGTKVEESYVYTLDGSALSSDAEVAVTYGYYTEEELIVGGDADSATNNIIGSESTNVVISTEANNGGSASFKGTRMDQKRWAWVNGEKYLVTWDAKSASDANVTVTMYGTDNVTHMVPGTRSNRTFTATSEWDSYQMYVVIVANKGSGDYFSLRSSATAYFDNYSVKRLTKAGIVPVYCDVNVTENADNGTVTVAEKAVQGEALDIKIVADTGYYVDSVTVDGAPVVLEESYEKTATATVYAYNEAYTYTIDAVAADVEIVVTYAAYNAEELVIGGNGEEAVTNVKADEVATTAVEVPGENGNKAFVAVNGKAIGIPRWNLVEGEKYLISWDAKAVSGTPVCYIYATGIGYLPNGVDGNGREYAGVSVDGWKSFTTILNVTPGKFDTPTVYPNSDSVYIDNFSIKRITKGAVTPEPPAPTEFDVTISGENAVVSVAAATSEGEAVNFTVAPKFGYYIESITIGEVDFTGFDAYKGGTYSTGEITADTEIVVTVAELSANTEDGVSTDVATLPAVFAPADAAPVTFGKVLADVATVDEFGIYLTKGGVGVTSAKTEMGPHFKAFYNVNGQYAIEFQGLAAGEYVAKTYVKVAGEITYGIATTFTVE